jgi:hypothetical protein
MNDPLSIALSIPLAVFLFVDLLMVRALIKDAAKHGGDALGGALTRAILVIGLAWFAVAAGLATAGWALSSPVFLILALAAAAPPVFLFARSILWE